jgi:lysophospholipase L1-like esterase
MRLRRWIAVALALSVTLNVVAAVLYLTRPKPAPKPDIYRMDRIDLFRQVTTKPELVMLGDSLTDRGEWHELLGPGVVNRGIAGDTLAGVMQRLDTVSTLEPKAVAIMIGINDLLAGMPVAQCAARYDQLIAALQRVAPRVIVQTVLPVGRDVGVSNATIQQLNSELRRLCADKRCELLDLFPLFVAADGFLDGALTTDGVHINGRGYRRWATQFSAHFQGLPR